jgi:hypothetical protein
VGFSVILVLVWLTELVGLPHLWFGEPAGFVWTRVLFRSAVLLAIWLWVHLSNRRLIKRLRHLEEFLLVCSWCRKVGHEGKWLMMEDYFGSHLHTETSHGICPECAAKQLAPRHPSPRASKPPLNPSKTGAKQAGIV